MNAYNTARGVRGAEGAFNTPLHLDETELAVGTNVHGCVEIVGSRH